MDKREIKSEILALYATVHLRLKTSEYNYEKMAKKLAKDLQRIYLKIQEKGIDIFERGIEESIRKRRHQDRVVTRLPEGQKQCGK